MVVSKYRDSNVLFLSQINFPITYNSCVLIRNVCGLSVFGLQMIGFRLLG